jgi:protein-L-isoaspartate(D-aspartate) O-methyltransferase
VVVGEPPVMEAQLVRRIGRDQWVRESLFETFLEPLVNAPQPPRFLF